MTPSDVIETVSFMRKCSEAEFNRFTKHLTAQGHANRIPFAVEIRNGKWPHSYPPGCRAYKFSYWAVLGARRYLDRRKLRTRTVNVPAIAGKPPIGQGTSPTQKKPRYAYQNWADPRR